MDALTLATDHILASFKRQSTSPVPRDAPDPLFVAIQGIPGSGKTTLAAKLQSTLSSPPYSLSVATLCIDDLRFSQAKVSQFAQERPDLQLFFGAGLPGFHEVELGVDILSRIKCFLQEQSGIELPSWDRNLSNGIGDRRPQFHPLNQVVRKPLDILLFEGWLVGYQPLSPKALDSRMDEYERVQHEAKKCGDRHDPFDCSTFHRPSIHAMNTFLERYLPLWDLFTCFIQVGLLCRSMCLVTEFCRSFPLSTCIETRIDGDSKGYGKTKR